MKKLFIVLSALVMLASCKKEKTTPPPIQTGGKNLIKYSIPSSPYEETYEYDAMGRLIKMDEQNGDLYTFTFSGNSVHIKEIRKPENNRVVSDLTCTVDAQGRIISGTGTQQFQQNNPQTVQFNYEYNADGYLVKLTKDYSTNTDLMYIYNYTGGDLVEEKHYENGQFKSYMLYEYYLDKPNKQPEAPQYTIGPATRVLEGKPNAHLLKNGKFFWANNTPGWTFNRSYTLDPDGYPTKMTVTGSAWNFEGFFYYDK